MRRWLVLITALLLAIGVAACGDDKEKEASAPESTTPAETATAEATEEATPEADLKDLKTKPVIAQPSGDPPTKLVKEDIVKGKGKVAKAGDTVSVQYVGANWSNGQEFDASWDRGQPFEFQVGAGMVIQGWDKGIPGMRVGGRRKLIIPPDQGYGPAGSPPAIGPDETLIFIVDLKKVG